MFVIYIYGNYYSKKFAYSRNLPTVEEFLLWCYSKKFCLTMFKYPETHHWCFFSIFFISDKQHFFSFIHSTKEHSSTSVTVHCTTSQAHYVSFTYSHNSTTLKHIYSYTSVIYTKARLI